MKIAIVCNFSYPSICGVWNRVYNDARYLTSMGHEVHVFSTNEIKGLNEYSPEFEVLENIKVYRYKSRFKIGENTRIWSCKKDLVKLKPDVIHAHVYRHYHTYVALKAAKKLSIPCFLTTHAPFGVKKLRSHVINLLSWWYDVFYGKRDLKNFDKIITITKWENEFLFKLGVDKGKIIYIPNGIPNGLFIERKINNNTNKVLFLGRIAEVKNLEVLIKACKEAHLELTIVGPGDPKYIEKLKSLNSNARFKGAIQGIDTKLRLFNSHNIFVLPSLREAMPQSLIEAMAAGLLVISSKTMGGKELIKHGYNGYLFDIGILSA